LGVDALVVVVDRDGEDLLGALLADDVLVEDVLDLGGLGGAGEAVALLFLLDLLGDDVVAEADALVADVDGGPGAEPLPLLLGLAAEGAAQVPPRRAHVVALAVHLFMYRAWTEEALLLAFAFGDVLLVGDDVVDEAVLLRLAGAHEVVALGVVAN